MDLNCIHHLTEKIFGSNEHMIRTPKINIKNRNTIKKNFSPNDTTVKNNLKEVLIFNTNGNENSCSNIGVKNINNQQQYLVKRNDDIKEIAQKIKTNLLMKLKLKKRIKTIQHI